ncbi:hypothetical protein YC2023_017553 [Brassica napus]
MRELESDLLEDDILAQQVKGKDRAVTQRGVKRNQKGFEVVNKRYMTKVLMMKIHNQEVDPGQN